MFKAGKKQAEVARLLSVSRQSVSRWYKDWKQAVLVVALIANMAVE
ncbi:MAG: helix-turn-helix domain-containing protein [Planctomycetes bacterium]|nr:helix-turn-helix domain-containing protein [Planctomycetota bacterium]